MSSGRLLDDWIQSYMVYTAQSRSPDEYHIWTAISTIAGAIRRKAFFTFEYFLLYPNLYIILVGPAGRCKKSTAMRIGRRMLSQVPGINFSTDSVTRERLIQDLTQSFVDSHSSMTTYSSEFASLLTSSGMDMVVFLTDIYDCPEEWSHKTKLGGTNKIKGPYLNLEGGTTPDWIARSLPLDTVGIGLTSRIIFVYQDTPRIRPAFPKLTPDQIELGRFLMADLAKIALLSGEYKLDEAAFKLYTDWDMKFQEHGHEGVDPRLSGYYERKAMHVLKVGMCIAASKRDELVITGQDLQAAFDLLDHIEPAMEKVFANVGKNPLSTDIAAVDETLAMTNGKGMEFGELMNKFKHSVRKDELEEVLATLHSIGAIRVVQGDKGPRYFHTD